MNQKQNDAVVKKLLYKSRNRGCKETDLLLGNFATKTLSDMSLEELRDFARILEQNDADIYDWLTNKSPLPTDLRSNIMTKLLEFYNLNNA